MTSAALIDLRDRLYLARMARRLGLSAARRFHVRRYLDLRASRTA